DLLGLGGLVRGRGVLGAAEGLPGGAGELQAAVVAVAGVDGPVAAGLALGDLVPDGAGGGGALGADEPEPGDDYGAAGGGGDLRGDARAAEGDGTAGGAVGVGAGRGHRGLLAGMGKAIGRDGRAAGTAADGESADLHARAGHLSTVPPAPRIGQRDPAKIPRRGAFLCRSMGRPVTDRE